MSNLLVDAITAKYDEIVIDLKAEEAAAINNQGWDAQREYILSQDVCPECGNALIDCECDEIY